MFHASAPDGAQIAYDIRGQGDEAIVLLAGQANSHRWWDAVRSDFDATYRTIAPDWRGTGDSDKPDDDSYSTAGFAADVIAVLDHAGVATAHIYGTSMGGRVAQLLAADYPDRVARLILGCTSPGGRHGYERDRTVIASLTQPDRDAAHRALLELMYTPQWLADHSGPYATTGDPGMPEHARAGHLRASRRHDGWDALARIVAPTLVVHGGDDVFNPVRNAPLIAQRILNAQLELIPGARHAYFEEFRDVASRIVLDFLARDRAG